MKLDEKTKELIAVGARGKDAASDDPVGILKSRYAKGEISREEYDRMKQEFQEEK